MVIGRINTGTDVGAYNWLLVLELRPLLQSFMTENWSQISYSSPISVYDGAQPISGSGDSTGVLEIRERR